MSRKRCIMMLTAGLTVALLAGPAQAGHTGVLSGRILYETGPLPGVTVTAISPNLQGERYDITNENGIFRLAELPPGVYMLTAALEGMKTIEQTGLRVQINRTSKLEFAMELSDLEISIRVTGDASVVDVTTSVVGINVEREFTERLPNSDDFQEAFQLSGGVNGGGNVRVHGGGQMDNLYLFDGIDTTDPVTGTFGANLNADAIEQVEVQTGGFQAEYGRSLGGIVNAITKSGGNKFSGALRLKYVDQSWTSDDRRSNNPVGDQTWWEPTVSLGGPILKDKLWFFLSYKRIDLDGEGAVLKDEYIENTSDPDARKLYDTSQIWEFPFAKLTFQPVPSHKFVATWNDDSAEIPTADPTSTQGAQQIQNQGGPFYGLEWTWIMDARTFLTVRGGLQSVELEVIPRSGDASTPSINLVDEGSTYGNFNRWNEENRKRYSMSAALSRFITGDESSHDLKGGLEYQHLTTEELDYPPGNARYSYYDDGHWEATTTNFGDTIKYDGNYFALFLQDNWEPWAGLTVSPGLRYEYVAFETDRGDEAGKFDFMLAPRLGAAWDIGSNRKSKLHGSFGRYYNPLDLQLPSQLSTQLVNTNWEYYPDPAAGRPYYDPDPNDPGYHPPTPSTDNPNGWQYQNDTGAVPDILDPDIKPEYSDEIVLGYEREVVKNFSTGLTFTRRWTRDIVEDIGMFVHPDTGEFYDVYQVKAMGEDVYTALWPNGPDFYQYTNPDGARRDYWGVELTTKGRTKRFDWLASYTYSETKGTVIGTQPGANGFTHFSGYYDTPSLTENLYGYLPWDCTHYVKLSGNYRLPFGTNIGVTVVSKDGYAYSRLTEPSDGMYSGSRWSTETEGRGTYRTPWWTFMDVSLQQDVDFGRFGLMTFILDISNVTDSQTATTNTNGMNDRRPWLFDSASTYIPPRQYTASVKYSF